MREVLNDYINNTILNAIINTLFILVSLSGMIKYINQLRKVNQGSYSVLSAGEYVLLSIPKDIVIFLPKISSKEWGRVSLLSIKYVMALSLSFIFGPLRSVQIGVRVVTGISFGFMFYVLDNVFRLLSLFYHISPMLGALLLRMLFLTISIVLLFKLR
ncbi:LptF/LptG family permease [Candidatus Palibaumannia cicadellinicola]|uniref:LptF/LptG family permease n=1 Tax=Candidatus Palibaumannia cicadellinicola TaxID=186490 RepID=UPI000571F257|nr:LptF/LptG family permease [Candidatus Baumannia cicadellinicola]